MDLIAFFHSLNMQSIQRNLFLTIESIVHVVAWKGKEKNGLLDTCAILDLGILLVY